MLYEFEVTLTQNRTDTVRFYAESIIQVLDFYQTFSNAKITMIKKVVYKNPEEDHFIDQKYDAELRALVHNDEKSSLFTMKFPKKNLDKDEVIQTLKQYLLHLKKPITKVNNIVVYKN
ncbi:MAG: hypothetical protein GXO30_04840 [Epsilonproteobacteria bacterium]|nr:hypothetical protein [Campylobacterota bacterium]